MSRFFLTALLFKAIAFLWLGDTLYAADTHGVTANEIGKRTSVHFLKNKTPVIYVEQNHSDIVYMGLDFDTSTIFRGKDDAFVSEWFWRSVPLGAEGIHPDEMLQMIEEHEMDLKCHMERADLGKILGGCSIETVRPFWILALRALSGVTMRPSFPEKQIKLKKDTVIWEGRVNRDQVGIFSGELLGSLYFPIGHPFETRGQVFIQDMSRDDLKRFHDKSLKVPRYITVISPMSFSEMEGELNASFGVLSKPDPRHLSVKEEKNRIKSPIYNPEKAYIFAHRLQKNFRISIRFNGPSFYDFEESLTAEFSLYVLNYLLIELADKMKEEETYHSNIALLKGKMGIGEMFFRVPNPNKLFLLLGTTINMLKKTPLARTKLDRFKKMFIEEHLNFDGMLPQLLGEKLAFFYAYHKNIDQFFAQPKLIQNLTAEVIQKQAEKILKNFWIEVIGDSSLYKEDAVLNFIKTQQ